MEHENIFLSDTAVSEIYDLCRFVTICDLKQSANIFGLGSILGHYWVHPLRAAVNNKSTKIAPDLVRYTRHMSRCIVVILCAGSCNEVDRPKDKPKTIKMVDLFFAGALNVMPAGMTGKILYKATQIVAELHFTVKNYHVCTLHKKVGGTGMVITSAISYVGAHSAPFFKR